MPLKLIGVHHQSCPLALRERLAFSQEDTASALQQLMALPGVEEAWLLSTCGRVEILCLGQVAFETLERWFAAFHGLDPATVQPACRRYGHEQALHHVLRVAAGLDSALLGETQIMGQVKNAIESAMAQGSLGPMLGRLLEQLVHCAKGIRNHSQLSQHVVSMPSQMMHLSRAALTDLTQAKVLVIGAGEIIQDCMPYLQDAHCSEYWFCNRSLDKAQALASTCAGRAIPMNDLPEQLPHMDVIITATSTPLPIISTGLIQRSVSRRTQPLVLFDLAVPRDVESEAAHLPGVLLYNIDDLHQRCQANRQRRQQAAQSAEQLAQEHTYHLLETYRLSLANHSIGHMRQHMESLRDECFNRAIQRLRAGQNPEDVLQCTLHQLTQALLHTPTQQMRHAASRGDMATLSWLQQAWHAIRDEQECPH